MLRITGLLFLLSVMLPCSVWGHGTGAECYTSRAVPLRFYYSDGQPMAYAEIEVFGPGNTDIEFQNGRTDANGVFAFVPDRDGAWKAAANDGMGHRAEIAVNIDSVKERPSTATPENAVKKAAVSWETAALGISLILNLCLAAAALRRRR